MCGHLHEQVRGFLPGIVGYLMALTLLCIASGAVLGAVLLGTVAGLGGGNAAAIEAAQNLGASVGSRTFSKSFELEADSLGTVIAWNAGYDPVRGADFFARIPDPGDQFLGTHPPNADRQKVVQATAARLG